MTNRRAHELRRLGRLVAVVGLLIVALLGVRGSETTAHHEDAILRTHSYDLDVQQALGHPAGDRTIALAPRASAGARSATLRTDDEDALHVKAAWSAAGVPVVTFPD